MRIKATGISSKKMTLLTLTVESSRFTVKAFEEFADGSAFCDDLNLHISLNLLKLRVPTKVESKRINQANYFYTVGHPFHVPLHTHNTEILFI